MKSYNVVAAVIQYQGKFLCALKGQSKFPYLSNTFEFPGGKVEPGETSEQALIREIKEELNLDIQVHKYLVTVDHSYPDFKILLKTYLCECQDIDKLLLNEHIGIEWLSVKELQQLHWAAADIPIVNYLLDNKI
ncbi:(deoxy)nucleoside triphosphate pyrophosphohydrolase [Acinetobacter zhairhuonensis]|uniref:(deoxy)nucleoside triphosphate pyrophosphohydrolase n=1 Tax=Acinetobacter sp. A7.4 TaxID=2919921 RepID=UPI001F4FA078|nr:(deoxy)nucleoside triphosphate pyrophosphohydrolase [Acinetobacter sp. A7.4]MCJ8162315.1 (deoxy)nucleoside triphosphate pyrophosphohydrolase [Acinetobacter sp. A7.4]